MNTRPEKGAQMDSDPATANAVMASLCCVATQYASKPSVELARRALHLAQQLAASQSAESELLVEVAEQLVKQWNQVLSKQMNAFYATMPGSQSVN